MTTKPVFGLITRQVAPIESGSPFGRLTPYYRQLIERAALLGWSSFVFSPRDVLRQRGTIWGWVRDAGSWKREFVTLPHVAYTQLAELTDPEMEILLWLRSDGNVQFINQPEIDQITQDRWRLLQILQSHPTLTPYIADTALLRDQESLTELLSETPRCHIEGRIFASKSGQAFLSRDGEDYLIRHEVGGIAHTRTARSITAVREQLTELFGDAIAQPYRDPLRFERCPVLIRSVWQRKRNGPWQESCTMLRLGQPESQTYQGVTAGILDRYEQTLQSIIGSRFKSLRYQIRNAGRTVVDLLSQRGHGAGELSVDFLVTQQVTIIITAVSTVAGLDSLRQLASPEPAAKVLTTTLGYAASLYEQSSSTTVSNPESVQTG